MVTMFGGATYIAIGFQGGGKGVLILALAIVGLAVALWRSRGGTKVVAALMILSLAQAGLIAWIGGEIGHGEGRTFPALFLSLPTPFDGPGILARWAPGVGFWMSLLGGVVALAGSSMTYQKPAVRAGAAIALVGTLVVVVGLFLPWVTVISFCGICAL